MTNLCSHVWPRMLVLGLLVLAACQTTAPSLEFGLQAPYKGLIPARIAVLPCLAWPLREPLPSSELQAAPSSVATALCTQYDQFILKSFEGQPFMKGFTPALISKLVTKAGKPLYLSELVPLWSQVTANAECEADCNNTPSVYQHLLATAPLWRTWLQDLSRMTHYSDAVLLPFLQGAGQRQYNDRGLLIAERQASLVLLLIDTNNGALIWSGVRQSKVTAQQLRSSAANDPYPPYPGWDTLTARLFNDDLWREFPGKQWY